MFSINMKFIVLYVLFGTVLSTFAYKLPSYINVCNRNEPHMMECISKNVEIVRPYLQNGIPEMLIPSINPLIVPRADLATRNFNVTFIDIKVYNVELFDLHYIKLDTKNFKAQVNVTLYKLKFMSKYEAKGRVLVLDIDSKGDFEGNFDKIDGCMFVTGKSFQRNGKEFVKWTEDKFDVIINNTQLQFKDLFGANEELSRHTNELINQNIDILGDEILPVIKTVVSEFILGIFNRVFDRFSYDQLFPL